MNTAKHERQTVGTAEVDRRAHLRVKLDAAITARRIGGGDTFSIDEASIAGFSTTSAVPFEPESTHHFRFTDAGGQFVIVGAICRHCTLIDGSEPPSYLVGFQLELPPARRVPLILGVIHKDAT